MPWNPIDRRAVLGAMMLTLTLGGTGARASEAPVIAAAASLQFALEEIADAFAAEAGEAVRISFGASGNLRRQIEQGAPFEVFLSADEEQVLALDRAGMTEDEGVVYAVGRLVLLVPAESPIDVERGLDGLAEALDAGAVRRFAIANPEHAPYGVAAVEALTGAGLMERIRPRLVIGENIAQAAQYALSGSAEGGLTAYSLVLAPEVAAQGGRFVLLPESTHTPLRQRMALVAGAGDTARHFHAFLQGPAAGDIFERHGFTLPTTGF